MKVERLAVGKNLAGMDVNIYFIINNNKCIVIDPGDEFESIQKFISNANIFPEFIILTHGHIDHIKDAGVLSEYYNIPVFIHKSDENFISNNSLNLSVFVNIPFSPFNIGKTVEDNEILFLDGAEIEVIHTPGHTPGSICLIFENNIITGDTIFAEGGVGRTDLPLGDEVSLMDSIKNKLLPLNNDFIIYPGHGKIDTLENFKNYFVI